MPTLPNFRLSILLESCMICRNSCVPSGFIGTSGPVSEVKPLDGVYSCKQGRVSVHDL